MDDPAQTPSPLLARLNLWIERGDRVVLSQWRVRLLEAIEDTGSISAAAERMNVPYHGAWNKPREMEAGLEVRLVVRQRGGARGGSTRLTAEGRDLVTRFNRYAQAVEETLARAFEEAFGDL